MEAWVNMLVLTNLDGQVDTSFGNGGKVVIDLPASAQEMVTEVRVLPDGKILIAGNALGAGLSSYYIFEGKAFIGRLLPNGQIDSTFGVDGFVFRHWETNCNVSILGDVSIDDMGRIVIAGVSYDAAIGFFDEDDYCYHRLVVCRYLPDGQVDSTFGTNGEVRLTNTGATKINALLHYEDGRILMAGVSAFSVTTPTFTYVARLLPDGAMDNNFSGDGYLRTHEAYIMNEFNGGHADPFGIIRFQNRIIVGANGGITEVPYVFGAFALTETGVIDTTFSDDGSFAFHKLYEPRSFINEITSTAPDNFFLSGYTKFGSIKNMFIGKVKVSPPSSGTVGAVQGNGLGIYPNPAPVGGGIAIDLGGVPTQGSNLELSIRDIQGRVVYQKSCAPDTDIVFLGIAGLVPGAFVVEINDGNIQRVGRLIVRER